MSKSDLLLKSYPPGWKAEPGHSYFTLHQQESDISRLRFEPGVGTILDKSLPREFEFRIYERSVDGYCGLCGQYSSWPDAVAQLLDMAGLSPTEAPEFKAEFQTT